MKTSKNTMITYSNNMRYFNLILLYMFLLTIITNLNSAFSTELTNEIHINWYNTNFSAVDVGVGSKGDVFVIGIDRNLYFYEFRTNQFILIEKDLKLKDKSFQRLDVDENGIPFVITNDSEIYFYSEKGKWVHLPGCARDIGVGKNQNLWKIGCNEDASGGFGIWNLFCFNNQKTNNDESSDNNNSYDQNNSAIKDNYISSSNKSVPSLIYEKLNNERKMNSSNNYRRNRYKVYQKDSTQINFEINKQNELEESISENYSNCFWLKSDAAGIRIDVGENGNPVIADKGGNLKIYNLNSKKTFEFEGVKVRDVTVSNDGIIFVTDFNDFSIYKLSYLRKKNIKDNDHERDNKNKKEVFISNLNSDNENLVDYESYQWTKISGKAFAISAGPYSQPFIVNREGLVMTSSKFGFN